MNDGAGTSKCDAEGASRRHEDVVMATHRAAMGVSALMHMQRPMGRPEGVHTKAPVPMAGVAPRRFSPVKENSRSPKKEKKGCTCKQSQCLKLYCECFASGGYCHEGCKCENCCNNVGHEDVRQQAVESILERNPDAFRPKVASGGVIQKVDGVLKHNKGCNCKKTGCLKKYCECFQAGVPCSDNCKCIGCKNLGNIEYLESSALADGSVKRLSTGSASSSRPALAPAQVKPLQISDERWEQFLAAARAEVIRPEVIKQLAILLFIIADEEREKWARESLVFANALTGDTENIEEDDQLATELKKLKERQHALIATEFLETLKKMKAVIYEKAKEKAYASRRMALAPNLIHASPPHPQASRVANLQASDMIPYHGGPIPEGFRVMYCIMKNGMKQLVLVRAASPPGSQPSSSRNNDSTK